MSRTFRKINIKTTEEELQKIKSNASRMKMCMSEFIRQMCTKGFVLESNNIEWRKVVWEINKIGVNINQIVKLANERKFISDDAIENLAAEHRKVWQILDDFINQKEITENMFRLSKLGS